MKPKWKMKYGRYNTLREKTLIYLSTSQNIKSVGKLNKYHNTKIH